MKISSIDRFLIKGNNERTKKAKKNIYFGFLLKGISVLISFLLVPITINYLNPSEYGIWLTLSSILGWISFFDIGLGNGLRNRLAEALAEGNVRLGKVYVSTTFTLLLLIMLAFFIVFLIVNPMLDWNRILNVPVSLNLNLSHIVLVVFAFFCLQFIFKTIGFVLLADQNSALNDLISVLGNLFALIVIYLLTIFTSGSLKNVAFVFSAIPFIVLLIAFIFLFNRKYSAIKPAFSFVKFQYTKDLMGLGIQFFIIQIAVCIAIYTSTNIIISQILSSKDVTTYNIAFKYFNALSMIYLIVIVPFWGAATEAFVKKDFDWIKLTIRKLLYIFSATLVIGVAMVLFSNIFYSFWIKDKVIVPFSLSVIVALYVTLFNWSNTFINFINGFGKIKLQLYTTVIVAIIYIPLAVYMGHKFGLNGIVFASCLSLVPTSVLMPIQCVKIYKNKARGIWFK